MNRFDTSTNRTRVKICGITRPEDALCASGAGADAIGLVFYDKSPRAVVIEQACEIISVLPPFVSTVGLFVNAEAEFIQGVLAALNLDVLQFHGDESAADCRLYNKPYIKAVRMREDVDLAAKVKEYPDTMAILLDTYIKDKEGGTGQVFDWNLIPSQAGKPIILAGGLRPDNIRQAIEQVHPYAVDVSGGVESEKGIKDSNKIEAFIQEVKHAES